MIFQIKKLLKIDFLRVLTHQAISSGSNFIFIIIYARTLGVEAFGYYSLILFFGYLLNMIGHSSIGSMMYLNLDKYKKNRAYYQSYILIKFLLVLFVAFCILLIADVFSNFFESTCLIFTFIGLFFLYDTFKKYFFSLSKFNNLIIVDFAYIIVMTTQLFVHNQKLIASDILMMNCYAFFISCVLGFCFIQSKLIRFNKKYIYIYFKNEIIKMKHLVFSSFLQWFNSRIGFYILGILYSTTDVGIVSGYLSIIGILNPIFLSLDNYLLPKSSRILNKSGLFQAINEIELILKKLFLPLILVFLLLFIFRSEIIISILGVQFAQNTNVFVFLLVAYFFNLIVKKYTYIINLVGRQDIFSKINMYILLFVLTFSYIVIEELSIFGLGIILCLISIINYISLRYSCREYLQ